MEKKYVKINFNLPNSKKKAIVVKTIQKECTDERLKSFADFVSNFIDGTKTETTKIVETNIQ